MNSYAVVSAAGTQLWVESTTIIDLQCIPYRPGDMVLLPRVLFANIDGHVACGHPCLSGVFIRALILGHSQSAKVIIFKMTSKKKTSKSQGHRSSFTRVMIDSISVLKHINT